MQEFHNNWIELLYIQNGDLITVLNLAYDLSDYVKDLFNI